MRILKSFVFVCLVSAPFVTTAADRTVVGSGAMEQDSWSGAIGGMPVEVVNRFGDVRLLRGGADDQLDVAAVIQQLAIDGSKLALDVTTTDDAVTVTVTRYDYQGHPVSEAPRGDRARADLAVTVPDGASMTVETIAGRVISQGVHGSLDLRTDRGAVQISEHSGSVDASSSSGAIEVSLGPGATDAGQTLTTATGPISVSTPDNNDLEVTMSTSGSFITDYSITVKHHDGEQPNKTATAVIGAGGTAVTMTSGTGDLALHRARAGSPR